MGLIKVQLEVDGPITELDEGDLIRSDGGIDNEVERTTWIEYRLKSDPAAERAVHRSVDMYLKKAMVFSEGEAAKI
jgi:hypothetical protein